MTLNGGFSAVREGGRRERCTGASRGTTNRCPFNVGDTMNRIVIRNENSMEYWARRREAEESGWKVLAENDAERRKQLFWPLMFWGVLVCVILWAVALWGT